MSNRNALVLAPCAALLLAAPAVPAQNGDDHFDSPVGFRREAALAPSLHGSATPLPVLPPARLPPLQPLDTTRFAPLISAEAFARLEPDGYTRRNALLLGGVGVLTFAALWSLPENTSKWGKEDKRFSKFLDAYSSLPRWDADPWPWNYVAHPVFGMYTYLMERNYGATPWRSFVFSTVASFGWEYVYEAWMEHPSTQDLLFTSTTGALLGELAHRYTRRASRDGFNFGEKIAVTLLNPAYTVQHGFRPRRPRTSPGISPIATPSMLTRRSSGTVPALSPLNPNAASRTALFAPAFIEPHPGWRGSVEVEYGSAAESARGRFGTGTSRYLLDAEYMRATLSATRDIGASTFVSGQLNLGGAYDGMLDELLDWFHTRVGITMQVRDNRPTNHFADTIRVGNTSAVRERAALYLGDLRATLGRRHGARNQTLLTVTLPVGTSPDRYGHGTVSLGVIHAARWRVRDRLTIAGSAGVGVTPSHGPLADVQRTVFASGSTGLRLKLWGGQFAYYSLFAHSPYYRGTGMAHLDAAELTHDFGWITRLPSGREVRLGLTEDTHRDDPSLDVIFKLSATW
ncbi:MAG TPA: DUF3943 domain-containing protein [Gemmatimonadaceae bacterium]|nr:DUF3943 domain-containing protein [Gemmatimonadaceae bacterium]